MNKEEFKVTHGIINIPREEINCSDCKHWGEQTCVPYGLGCQYEPIFPFRNRSIRLSQAQLNRINEIVKNLIQENKQLKDKIKEKIKDLQENNNGDDYSVENVANILKDLLGDKE